MEPAGAAVSRALGDRPVKVVEHGRDLFAEYCAGCHGMKTASGALRLRYQPLPAPGPGRGARTDRHRPRPLGVLHAELLRRAEYALRRLPLALQPFPQDRRLCQSAARRHLGAIALPPQRLRADLARPARASTSRNRPRQNGIAAATSSTPRRSATAPTATARHRRSCFFTTRPCPAMPTAGMRERPIGTELPSADKDAIVEYMKTL